jgi:hypothetical protein
MFHETYQPIMPGFDPVTPTNQPKRDPRVYAKPLEQLHVIATPIIVLEVEKEKWYQ